MKLRTPNRVFFATVILRDDKGKVISRSVCAIKDYTGRYA